MKRSSLCFMIVWLASLTLSACGGATTQAPASEQPDSLVVTDALSRTIEFDTPPQRIVIAGQSSLTIGDAIYLFPEAKTRLVAQVVGRQPVGDFLALVDATWGQKIILETGAGPEQIAPLNPDVVLMRSFLADKLGKSLEQLGLLVVYVDLETPEQYFRSVDTLGQLIGNPVRAQEIRAFYESRMERIAQALSGLSDEQKPRVLLVEYSDQGGAAALNVPSTSWLQTIEVELAGGAPVWKEAAQAGGWTVVNFEQIAAWNPDKIFVIHYEADSAGIVAQLKADAQWQALQAVQNGEIYGFPADILSWDQPDPRWILGVTWLAGKIHPDRFSELDMIQEALAFFGQMYGMDQVAIQEHILSDLKGSVP